MKKNLPWLIIFGFLIVAVKDGYQGDYNRIFDILVIGIGLFLINYFAPKTTDEEG